MISSLSYLPSARRGKELILFDTLVLEGSTTSPSEFLTVLHLFTCMYLAYAFIQSYICQDQSPLEPTTHILTHNFPGLLAR